MNVRFLGSVQRHNTSLNGTLRFEAILPNVSFQVQRIRTIPVLSTPLSIKLARRSGSSGPPQVGYVTLNQTRKIIPLLENDPAVSLTPLVGVWTAFDDISEYYEKYTNHSDQNNNQNNHHNRQYDRESAPPREPSSNVSNPLTWAICMRFLYNEHIKERAFVASDTFILVSDCPYWH